MPMFTNGRKTIGALLCDVASHYQQQICQTLSLQAQKSGYNVAYFSYNTCYGGVATKNGRGEANIMKLIPFERLDALILCHDTLYQDSSLEELWEQLEKRCKCPIITLRQDSGKYPCITVDSSGCIEQLVYHFIDEHNKKKLGFMSGPFCHPDSIKRLDEFKKALANRNIPFDEKMVFEGDFWSKMGKEAADYFTMELDECPEAIICANDYMAIALMGELIGKGFLVPDDIAVSGFDNIWESSISIPPITTISVPVEEMTIKALRQIERMWEGEEVERVCMVGAEMLYRNSCGCKVFDMQSMLEKSVRRAKEYQMILENNQSNTYMVIGLSGLDSLYGIERQLRLSELYADQVDSFFICLGEGRGDAYPKYRSANPGFTKKSRAIAGVFHKNVCSYPSHDTVDLLPKEVSEDKPMIYYFFPLHNNQYSFGYLAIAYEGIVGPNKTFQHWLAILGNALEVIRIKQKNQGLLAELNNLYVHDALTGLLNRRGFVSISENLYVRAKKEKTSFIIFAIDMDNLKVVNDRFGHMNGDLALKTIGNAMMQIAAEDDACARVGGDEYSVVGLGYTKENAESFVCDFNEYLEDFNATSNLPYLVKASIGYSIIEVGENTALEECINAADARLYEYKRKKKEEKRDSVLRE